MMNPPRETIQALVSAKLSYAIYSLAFIYALQSFFFYANWWSFGLKSPTAFLVILAAVLSPLMGAFWLYYMGMIYYFTGRLLGGRASFSQVQACWALSKTPCLISLCIWFILICLCPEHVFIQDSDGPSSIIVNGIALSIGTWSAVRLALSIRQIQSFSILKTSLNLFLSWILSSSIVFLMFCVFRLIYN